jgi:two-component system, OmpR family, sensor histidine kinase CiaH
MIQKLRFKFVALAMGLLFLVLAVIMGIVNLLNYREVVATADSILELLAANGGRFPDAPGMGGKPADPNFSPELPYESRYFTVLLDSSGNVSLTDTGKIKAIDTETAISYAQKAWELGRASGFNGNYRYALKAHDNGSIVIFLDCGRSLSSARSFLWISLGISLAGFCLVFFLLYFLSARIVKPIAESYEKQRQFITDASHDLKTPITIIDADASVLEMEVGENEWLTDIQKQTKRLTDLTNNLVFLSRMEENENHFQMIEFPLSDVIVETAQSYEALAHAQGKTFTLQVEPLISFCGDEKAFRQLTALLLDNALKYSNENGTILLTLKKADRSVRLSVYNTCAPIPQEDLTHLFDRFYRTDKSRNSQTGGHGIGLSVAKAIVTAHKGSISAASADGNSLTITAKFGA